MAVTIGVLRQQYNDKLHEHLPAIMAFTVTDLDPTRWHDVRSAMIMAAAHYKAPMSSLDAWGRASKSFAIAGAWADYALGLIDEPNADAHRESSKPEPIILGSTTTGRLGFGDAQLPGFLDDRLQRRAGAFSDIRTLQLTSKADVEIVMTCAPCTPRLTLVGPDNRRVATDAPSTATRATIRRSLGPGTYQVWISADSPLEVGRYEVVISARGR